MILGHISRHEIFRRGFEHSHIRLSRGLAVPHDDSPGYENMEEMLDTSQKNVFRGSGEHLRRPLHKSCYAPIKRD